VFFLFYVQECEKVESGLDMRSSFFVSRRMFLKMLLGLSFSEFSNRALGFSLFDSLNKNNAWEDRFDTRIVRGSLISNRPVLSLSTKYYTQLAIPEYRNIIAKGGWPVVPETQRELHLGMIHPDVSLLRQRLLISKDLPYDAGKSFFFDSYVKAAVQRFQIRHGLLSDGIVGKTTYHALNINAEVRLNQLYANLKRLENMMSLVLNEQRFVMVNIPEAQIEIVENDQVVQRHTAIVGKVERKTPIFNSRIYEIILNPFWVVPQSIIREDILPLMKKSPDYLSKNNIHMFDREGKEVFPSSIDWDKNDALSLTFRQDPGKINAMSSTKINFNNKYAVYMHDTPLQGLFNHLMRFDSSGCVRVHWDRARMEAVIRSRKNKSILLKDQVPLHFVYISAWSTGEDRVHFRDDIYHLDGDY
jgi:murein L,D-transpeptidase YcbB/YkuD